MKESINKIFNDRLQNKFLKEHLSIFINLGTIIEESRLVNQAIENKDRSKYITWNYYFNGVNIDNKPFDIEFDVVSRKDGENHYRLHRIKKANTQSTLPINGEVDFGVSAFSTNNIPKSNQDVKSHDTNKIENNFLNFDKIFNLKFEIKKEAQEVIYCDINGTQKLVFNLLF